MKTLEQGLPRPVVKSRAKERINECLISTTKAEAQAMPTMPHRQCANLQHVIHPHRDWRCSYQASNTISTNITAAKAVQYRSSLKNRYVILCILKCSISLWNLMWKIATQLSSQPFILRFAAVRHVSSWIFWHKKRWLWIKLKLLLCTEIKVILPSRQVCRNIVVLPAKRNQQRGWCSAKINKIEYTSWVMSVNCRPPELESGGVAKHSETILKLGPIYLPSVIDSHQWFCQKSIQVMTNIIA